MKNKTDKELLHLAAVAVDKTLVRTLTCDGWGEYRVISKNQGSDNKSLDDLISGAVEWNPLTDSAQAFELMVDLKMIVRCYDKDVVVDGWFHSVSVSIDDSDRLAVTRRAIVMLAAEIADGMQHGH